MLAGMDWVLRVAADVKFAENLIHREEIDGGYHLAKTDQSHTERALVVFWSDVNLVLGKLPCHLDGDDIIANEKPAFLNALGVEDHVVPLGLLVAKDHAV
jgi:hypothetical protein